MVTKTALIIPYLTRPKKMVRTLRLSPTNAARLDWTVCLCLPDSPATILGNDLAGYER